MPLRIKEFVIQAKFEDEKPDVIKAENVVTDTASLKEEIISECMEKLEEYLRKHEGR